MRSAVAKQHGLDESLVGEVTDPASSSELTESVVLTDAQKAAIELADALMTQPGEMPDELVARVRQHFDDEQILELTLDVMKWNYQKVPVALHTDPEVKPGELADLIFDDNGDWVRPS